VSTDPDNENPWIDALDNLLTMINGSSSIAEVREYARELERNLPARTEPDAYQLQTMATLRLIAERARATGGFG
jgi:hypothetical protein